MTEERNDKPDGFVADLPQEWWRDSRKLLTVAAAVMVVVLGVAAYVFTHAGGEAPDGSSSGRAARREVPSVSPSAEDPEETTSSAVASQVPPATGTTAPASASDTAPAASGTATDPPAAASTRTAEPETVALVAFRSGGALWVSAEDGTSPKTLLASGEGAYALSPDSRTLAAVSAGTLTLVDVTTGSAATVGPAVPVSRLSWAEDSSALVYSRPASAGGDVMFVNRDGSGNRLLVKGGVEPALSRDGRWLGYIDAERRARAVPVALAGSASQSQVETDGVTALCWGSGGTLFCATKSGPAPVLTVSTLDSSRRSVLKLTSARTGVVFGDLYASPDGKRLLFAERGDDGFSRTYVIGADGKGKIAVPCLRDAYPAGWSADGSRIFYFEGNAFQGQTTRLTSARADGTGRVTVAEAATR